MSFVAVVTPASACGELAEERNKWSSELRARVAREYAQERALRLQHHRLWAPCHHSPAESGSRGVDVSYAATHFTSEILLSMLRLVHDSSVTNCASYLQPLCNQQKREC